MSLTRTESTSIDCTHQNSTLFSNFNDSGLIKIVDDIERKFQFLLLENEILQKFLKRNDPQSVSDVQQSLDSLRRKTIALQLSAQLFGADSSTLLSRTILGSLSMTRSDLLDSTLMSSATIPKEAARHKINIHEKVEMVLFEIDQFRNEIQHLKSKADKSQINSQNQLDELDKRIDQIENARSQFQEFLDKKRITIDKFIRFLRENLKKMLIAIGKIRLHTNSLKIENRKLIKKLDNRQNLRLTLCPSDFEQLKIQNTELKTQLETVKIPHENQLRKLINQSNLKLNQIKISVKHQENQIEFLSVQNDLKFNENEKIRNVLENVSKENVIFVEKADQLSAMKEMYRVPEILDLLQLKINLVNLKDDCKSYERRNTVQKVRYASIPKDHLDVMIKTNFDCRYLPNRRRATNKSDFLTNLPTIEDDQILLIVWFVETSDFRDTNYYVEYAVTFKENEKMAAFEHSVTYQRLTTLTGLQLH